MDQHRLDAALVAYFRPDTRSDDNLSCDAIDGLLRQFQQLPVATPDMVSVLTPATEQDACLSALHHGRLAMVDLCFTQKLGLAAFPESIHIKLLGAIACLSRFMFRTNLTDLSDDHIAVSLFERLMKLCIGCHQENVPMAARIRKKLDSSLTAINWLTLELSDNMPEQTYLLRLLNNDLGEYIYQEEARLKRQEQRLVDAELGRLKLARAKHHASFMLNSKMAEKSLSKPLCRFLQGVWFNSVVQVLLQEGKAAGAFLRMSKLTETLVMIMQPENMPKQRQGQVSGDVKGLDYGHEGLAAQDFYRIIEHLPDELSSALVVLADDENEIADAIAPVEADMVCIMQGRAPEAFDFEALEMMGGLLSNNTRVSQSLINSVLKLNQDQWFVQHLMGAATEHRHIKLTLKEDELEHLVFTDPHGQKIMEISYSDFAYLLSSDQVTLLPGVGELTRNLRIKLKKLLQWHQKLILHSRQSRELRQQQSHAVGLGVEENAPSLETLEVRRLPVREEPELHIDADQQHKNDTLVQVQQMVVGQSLMFAEKAKRRVEVKVAVIDPFVDRIILTDLCGLPKGEFNKAQLTDLFVMGFCHWLPAIPKGQIPKPAPDQFRNIVLGLIARGCEI